MSVFLSYASDIAADIGKVAAQLRARGINVFHDEESLPPGKSYHDRIKDAVNRCDLFVFFISPESVDKGRYTLTELNYAKKRWPNPSGKVMPVMARTTDLAQVDPYITESLNILKPRGNFAAEVCNAIDDQLRGAKPWLQHRKLLVGIGAGLAVLVGAWIIDDGTKPPATRTEFIPYKSITVSGRDFSLPFKIAVDELTGRIHIRTANGKITAEVVVTYPDGPQEGDMLARYPTDLDRTIQLYKAEDGFEICSTELEQNDWLMQMGVQYYVGLRIHCTKQVHCEYELQSDGRRAHISLFDFGATVALSGQCPG